MYEFRLKRRGRHAVLCRSSSKRILPDLLKSTQPEAEVDISMLKINGVAMVGIVLAFVFSIFLRRLYWSSGDLTLNLVLALVLAALLLVVVFLQSVLIKDRGRIGAILFLETTVMLIPFIFSLSGFVLVGLTMTFLFLLWGSWSGRKELDQSIKVRLFRLSKFILPKAITGLSIFIAASYMSVFQEQGLVISRETFRRIISPAEAVTKTVMPAFSLEDTFESALLKSDPEIQKLPSAQKKEIIEKQKEKFGSLFRYNFESRDTIINILYDSYTVNAQRISAESKILILFVLGAVIFLLAKSIGTPISWLVALVAALVYEALIALGFAIVVLETRSKEIILLK